MTPIETVKFVALVSALWPQQRMEDATPDAWFQAGLKNVAREDAEQAANNLVAHKVFISLAEILTEVKAIRSRRLERIPLPAPNPDAGAREQQAQLQREIQRIADGRKLPRAITSGGGAEPSEEYLKARGDDPHRELRVAALVVQCPHCHATAGDRCTNAGNKPITTAPAHDARLVEAGLARWVEIRGHKQAELLTPERRTA